MDILAIFKTIVTVLYVPVCVVMILIILLQAGRGGMGTALGGGASQGVFGGGGASDFMAKLTQGFAVAFMASAVFLAYATAHGGSERLREKSDELDKAEVIDEGGAIDYERIGPNPLVLPFPGASGAIPSEPVVSEPGEAAAGEPAGGEPAAGEAAAGEPAAAVEAAAVEAAAGEVAAGDEAQPAGGAPAEAP